VGFEFEVYNSRDKFFFETNEGWYKTTMDFGVLGYMSNLYRLILDKQVRVKYLDKEDIESMGWEIKNKKWRTDKNICAEKINSKDPERPHCLWFICSDNMLIIDNGQSFEDETTFFRGIIKNKSELKKLMQQLNIK